MSSSKVRVVLIGAGRIGLVHLGNIRANPRINLTGIIEPVEAARNKAAEIAGVQTFASLKEALEKELTAGTFFEGVVICTPTYTHTDLIQEALTAGKHVMCEKPLGHDVKTIDGLYALSAEKKKHLLCGFHRRWDPNFSGVRQAVLAGACGKIHKIKSISRDNPVPSIEYLKISGGIVHDCASHDIDMLTWVLGTYPTQVYALAHCHDPEIKKLDDFDSVELVFNFPNQVIGTVDVTRKAVYGYDQRLEVVGDGGLVRADNHPKTSVVVADVSGFKHDAGRYSFPTRYPEAYSGELEHFVDLMKGIAAEPYLTGQHLHNITKILDAAAEAAKHGSIVQVDYS
jgi:myo-inositol 2-dehydrogenase/D-chiro-inositol 1-dehydrogenase